MNQNDLKKLRKMLMEKRDDLLQVVRSKKEDLREAEIGDEIDSASETAEKEMLFELTDNEKTILDAVEASLRKIEKGTYGKCEACGSKIPFARIEAIPWVRYCIDCQSKAEKS
ncbi:MAG: TraR/DksA family transcriptional regulator [Endomicrobiales bacterium]|nr:TraR/DksA family transcriptional regulator [Endomicrobiales bacterium]